MVVVKLKSGQKKKKLSQNCVSFIRANSVIDCGPCMKRSIRTWKAIVGQVQCNFMFLLFSWMRVTFLATRRKSRCVEKCDDCCWQFGCSVFNCLWIHQTINRNLCKTFEHFDDAANDKNPINDQMISHNKAFISADSEVERNIEWAN